MCVHQLQDEVPGIDLCKATCTKPMLHFAWQIHHVLLGLLHYYHDLTLSESLYMSAFVTNADSLIPELQLPSFFLIHNPAAQLRGHKLRWHKTPPFLLQKSSESKHYFPNTTNFQRECWIKIAYGVKLTEMKTLSFAIFTWISYDNITRNDMLTYDARI